ncbi:MAG: DUF5654 family protein [Candidatus Uhrbacteria bacterium]|nr:DUF5654 family protein [Candidatus Uhrbacteria bacterium]
MTLFKHVKNGSDEIKKTVRTNVSTYILAGLGFVAGLAWNDAIKGLIDFLFPADDQGLIAKFVYAFAITLFVIIATIVVTKLFKAEEESKQK